MIDIIIGDSQSTTSTDDDFMEKASVNANPQNFELQNFQDESVWNFENKFKKEVDTLLTIPAHQIDLNWIHLLEVNLSKVGTSDFINSGKKWIFQLVDIMKFLVPTNQNNAISIISSQTEIKEIDKINETNEINEIITKEEINETKESKHENESSSKIDSGIEINIINPGTTEPMIPFEVGKQMLQGEFDISLANVTDQTKDEIQKIEFQTMQIFQNPPNFVKQSNDEIEKLKNQTKEEIRILKKKLKLWKTLAYNRREELGEELAFRKRLVYNQLLI